MTIPDGHHPDDDFSDAIKALDRLDRPASDTLSDRAARMQVCRDRGHHLYATSTDVTEFTQDLQGQWRRRVPCTSCWVAVRIEVWNLQFDRDGHIVAGKLDTQYPGVDL